MSPPGSPFVDVAAASPGATDHPASGRTEGSPSHRTRYPPTFEGADGAQRLRHTRRGQVESATAEDRDEGNGRDDQRGDGDGREELAPTEAGLAQVVLDGAHPESDEEGQHHDVEREQDVEVGRERAHPVAGVERRHHERQRSDRCRLGRDAPTFSLDTR